MKNINEMNRMYPQAIALFNEREAAVYDDSNFPLRPDAVKITSQRKAEKIARRYSLKKRESLYYVTALHVTSMGITRRLAPRNFNRSYYYVPIGSRSVATATDGCVQGVDRYCDVYLNVTIESAELAAILDRPIFRNGDEFYQETESGSFRSLLDNVEIAKGELLDSSGNPKDGVLKFLDPEKSGYENLTAGQSKSFTVPLIAVNHSEFDARLVKYILTYGASEALQGEEEISMKDLAQGNNRLSQNEAPNTPTGYVGVTAYFMGKYKDISGKNDYRDGFGFARAGRVARLFSFLTDGRYGFSERAVEGILLQCRPHLCKLMAETVSGEYMSRFINLRHCREDVVCIVRSKVTDEQQAAFIEAVKSKGKKGSFAGKLVLLGDTKEELEAAVARIFGDKTEHEGHVDFLTDLNGLKAPFDLRFKTTLNILDISHETEDVQRGANLSTQFFQSMMYADWKKASKVLLHSFKKHVEEKREILEGEGSTPLSKDFDNPQLSQLLTSIFPRVATRWYFPILKQVGNALLKGLVNKAGALKVPTEGLYCKVTTDPAMDFGINILKVLDGGICEAVATRAFASEYKNGIAVKYPKQHFREFAKLRFISTDEYAKRVAACEDLSEEDKMLLVSKVDRTSGGQIILPCYELLKNMLAGMDFDGDAVIVYLDREIYDMMADIEPLAVVIEEDPAKKVNVEKKEEAFSIAV